MKLTKIIEPETKNYWWVLGQRFKGNELEKYIPTWLSHVSDIYYTEEGGIVNFYISKKKYDCYANPLDEYLQGKLDKLEQYEELGSPNEIRHIVDLFGETLAKCSKMTDYIKTLNTEESNTLLESLK